MVAIVLALLCVAFVAGVLLVSFTLNAHREDIDQLTEREDLMATELGKQRERIHALEVVARGEELPGSGKHADPRDPVRRDILRKFEVSR